MWNAKFNHKTLFTFCLFKQRKNDQTKQNKTVVKFIK